MTELATRNALSVSDTPPASGSVTERARLALDEVCCHFEFSVRNGSENSMARPRTVIVRQPDRKVMPETIPSHVKRASTHPADRTLAADSCVRPFTNIGQ